MENKEFLKNYIKHRACYYFGDIIKTEDFDFKILLDENLSENILIHDVSYKNFYWSKILIYCGQQRMSIKDYSGTKYLVLFGFEKYFWRPFLIELEIW